MNRTVKALTCYPQLIAEIERQFAAGQTVVFLVTDDRFAQDTQIWTESDRDEILADFAKQDATATVTHLRESFDASREIFHVDRDDLRAAREALA